MRVPLRVLALVPLLLTGCATTEAVATSPAVPAVDVPLTATDSPSSADDLIGWPGAAGSAVGCEGPVVGGTRTAPYEGEDTGSTPDAALAEAREWHSWSGAQHGFALARIEGARHLYALQVDGVVKQALILRRGPALKGDGSRVTVTRWWLESWARCDWSELPEGAVAEEGLQLWTDAAGRRQRTSTIVSFDFTGDCFPGMTALDVGGPLLGGSEKASRTPVEYVRNPSPELRDEYFERGWEQHVPVPADAIDSGFSRDGRHLWFAADRSAAYVGAPADAEAWPRALRPIRCA